MLSRIILFFVFCFFMFGCSAKKSPDNTEQTDSTQVIIAPVDSMTIDLVAWKEKGYFNQTQPVKVANDPVFHQAKSYQGIALRTVLERLPSFKNVDLNTTQVVFECEDGYNPSMSLEKTLSKQVFLAVKDMDAPKGADWTTIVKGPETKKIAPFYVVYTDAPADDYSYKWPYNLVKIRLTPVSAEAQVLFPHDDDTMVKGYDLFRIHCMTCHSVNAVGGKMGPELNFPKNVTEYWKLPDLKAFIKNPSSYRNEVKMPAQSHLSERELDEIIGYLAYMTKHKKHNL